MTLSVVSNSFEDADYLPILSDWTDNSPRATKHINELHFGSVRGLWGSRRSVIPAI